jgi:hypothetical protein
MKSNYKYKVGGDEFILSQEEHDGIVNGVKNGQSQFWLRNGTLMINMSITWHVTQSNDPTMAQREEMDNRLKLNPHKQEELSEKEIEQRKAILDLNKSATGFSSVLSSGGKKDCAKCGENHFIPSDRTMCLPCLLSTVKS